MSTDIRVDNHIRFQNSIIERRFMEDFYKRIDVSMKIITTH